MLADLSLVWATLLSPTIGPQIVCLPSLPHMAHLYMVPAIADRSLYFVQNEFLHKNKELNTVGSLVNEFPIQSDERQ